MTASAGLFARYRVSSEPLRSQRRIELVLLCLSVLVVLQLVWLALGRVMDPSVSAVEPAPDSLRVAPVAAAGAITASQSLALQARPLFWAERRPNSAVFANTIAEGTTSDGRPARRLEKLELTGIFGAGEQSGALVTHKGKRLRLLVGDELEGWTLQSVTGGDVVFVSAGARDVKRLLAMPVVEQQNSAPDMASAADAVAASEDVKPRVQKPVPSDKPRTSAPKNNAGAKTKAATLSLGGAG